MHNNFLWKKDVKDNKKVKEKIGRKRNTRKK